MDNISNAKFYYPMVANRLTKGYVQQLMAPTKTLYDYSIKDGAALILMGQASLVMKWRNQDILDGTTVGWRLILGVQQQSDLPGGKISRRPEGS